MTTWSKRLIVIALFVSLGINTGCSMNIVQKAKAEALNETTQTKNSGKKALNEEENQAAKKLITDYFAKLYSISLDKSMESSASGSIPSELQDYIAFSTLKLSEGNPEIGIHLPRFVSLNGVTTIGYELLKYSEKNESYQIDILFSDKKDDIVSYFVKVNLKAKCIPDEDFDTVYTRNPQTYVYEKKGSLDAIKTDSIKVQASYNVDIKKENKEFKVIKAVEADLKPGLKNRLSRYNNGYFTRLPYLYISNKKNLDTLPNKEEIELYSNEKVVIESFFNGLAKSVDSEKASLLYLAWSSNDSMKFTECLKKIEGTNDAKGKKLSELMSMGTDYMNRYEFDSFPLQANMACIKALNNFQVTPHPGYSENKKLYIVKFEADATDINGVAGEDQKYSYDYFVELTGTGGSTKISEIRLNEYFKVFDK